jgi:hypothetical protein
MPRCEVDAGTQTGLEVGSSVCVWGCEGTGAQPREGSGGLEVFACMAVWVGADEGGKVARPWGCQVGLIAAPQAEAD